MILRLSSLLEEELNGDLSESLNHTELCDGHLGSMLNIAVLREMVNVLMGSHEFATNENRCAAWTKLNASVYFALQACLKFNFHASQDISL